MDKKSRLLLSMFVAVVLGGCGNESPAPDGSTIVITPAGKTWDTSADDSCAAKTRLDTLFTISVIRSDGVYLNDTDLLLSLDLAAGTTSGAEVLELFDEGTKVAFPYVTKTGASGSKMFTMGMWVGCNWDYKGQLNVYSGSSYNSADFIVTVK
jgi:hypothetical protein